MTCNKLCCILGDENLEDSKHASERLPQIKNDEADWDRMTPFGMVTRNPVELKAGSTQIPYELMKRIFKFAYPEFEVFVLQIAGEMIRKMRRKMTFNKSVSLPSKEILDMIESQKVDSNECTEIRITTQGILSKLVKQVLDDKLPGLTDYIKSWFIEFSRDGKPYIKLKLERIQDRIPQSILINLTPTTENRPCCLIPIT